MTDFPANPIDSRRRFLHQAASLTALAPAIGLASEPPGNEPGKPFGKAENCILLWLGGGACHIDTWDPKRKGDG